MAFLPNYTLLGEATPQFSESLPGSNFGPNGWQQTTGCQIGTSNVKYSTAQMWSKDPNLKRLGTTNGIKVTRFHDVANSFNVTTYSDCAVLGRMCRANGTSMAEGDEEWRAFSWWFPLNWNPGTGWGTLSEWASNHTQTHPSYGGSPVGIESVDASQLFLRFKSGLLPNPGSSDFNPILVGTDISANDPRWNGPSKPAAANGWNFTVPLLGSGAPPSQPFTKGVWHDFYYYARYNARTNGIFEIWHREEGGNFVKVYSNRNDGTALINHAPHPTFIFNAANGCPGESGSIQPYYQNYRFYSNIVGNDVIYWHGGDLRRQTQQEILDAYGGGTAITAPPDPAANHIRIGQAQPDSLPDTGTVDTKRVIKRGVGVGNSVAIDQGYAYMAGPSTGGAAALRMIVHDDDGSADLPGSLIGVSDQVTLAQGAAAAWVSFPFSTPAQVTGDQFYFGVHYGGPGTSTFYYLASPGQGWRLSDTFGDGPSNPFGITPFVIAVEPGMVADYTPSGDVRAPVFLSASADYSALSLLYDETLETTAPSSTAFFVTVNQQPWPLVPMISIIGAQVLLTLANPVLFGDIVTVSYIPPETNPLQDAFGNLCVNLPSRSASNQTQPQPGARNSNPAQRVAIARRIDPSDRRAGEGGGL